MGIGAPSIECAPVKRAVKRIQHMRIEIWLKDLVMRRLTMILMPGLGWIMRGTQGCGIEEMSTEGSYCTCPPTCVLSLFLIDARGQLSSQI